MAIAYVMHKATNVFPIIGGRKVEHLKDNLEGLDISLSPEQIKYIDGFNAFAPGFPNAMIVRPFVPSGPHRCLRIIRVMVHPTPFS